MFESVRMMILNKNESVKYKLSYLVTGLYLFVVGYF